MQTVNPYFEIGFANGMYMYTFSAREGPPVEYLSKGNLLFAKPILANGFVSFAIVTD